MEIFVLDREGYDVRGGNAAAFRTLEGAMASLPHVTWSHEIDDGHEWWEEEGLHDFDDQWVISRCPLGD